MKLPSLKIRNFEVQYPVIQAGMGVKIGTASLASAVIRCGGCGTIASVGLGDIELSKQDFVEDSNRSLVAQIREARALSGGKKGLGVNVMAALSNYREMVEVCIQEKVDYIISGAGLPLTLPEHAGDADIALIPVISSGRALEVVLKTWIRRYNRKPDAVVVEGPLCGGHLGFSMEMLAAPETCSLAILFRDVKKVAEAYGLQDIPVLAAGEVNTREDIENFLKMGYNGVQVGTRFIMAEESGIDRRSKQVWADAGKEDVTVIKSPVGLPVRVLKTPLVRRLSEGKREPFTCPYHCLRSCKQQEALFCIAKALLATWRGDLEHGLYMTGCSVDRCDHIFPVKEFFDTLAD